MLHDPLLWQHIRCSPSHDVHEISTQPSSAILVDPPAQYEWSIRFQLVVFNCSSKMLFSCCIISVVCTIKSYLLHRFASNTHWLVEDKCCSSSGSPMHNFSRDQHVGRDRMQPTGQGACVHYMNLLWVEMLHSFFGCK